MNVLFVANGYPSRERPWKCPFNHRAVKSLSELANCTVLAVRGLRPHRRRAAYTYDDVSVQEISVISFVSTKAGSFVLFRVFWRPIIALLRRQIRPYIKTADAVHSVSLGFHAIAAHFEARRAGIPHFIQIIGSDITRIDRSFAQCRLARNVFSEVSCFISNSQDLARRLKALSGLNLPVKTIYRGVDIRRFRPSSRKGLKKSSDPVSILYLGGKISRDAIAQGKDTKGGDVMLRAWTLIVQEVHRPIRLLIGGPGICQYGLDDFVNSLDGYGDIVALGCLDYGSVPDILQSADILVIPSRDEGLPNVLLEGMAAGLCLIATKVGGIPEIVEDSWDGLLVPPGDHDTLAKVIIRVVNDEALRMTIGLAARRKVVSDLRSDQYGTNLINVYERYGNLSEN